jgi:hypothetical protein
MAIFRLALACGVALSIGPAVATAQVYSPYTIPVSYHTKFDVAPRHFRQAAAPHTAGIPVGGVVQHEGVASGWQYGPAPQYTGAVDCDHCCDHVWDGYCAEWHGWCDGPHPGLGGHHGACGGHHGACGSHHGGCAEHGHGCDGGHEGHCPFRGLIGAGHGMLRTAVCGSADVVHGLLGGLHHHGHGHRHGCQCGECGIDVSALPADRAPLRDSTAPPPAPSLPRNELPTGATSLEGEVESPVVRCSTNAAVSEGVAVQASTAPTVGDSALLQMLYGAASTRVAGKVCGD